MNDIKKSFDTIIAEDNLKQNTMDFLRNERTKREKKVRYRYKYAAVCAVMLVVVFLGGSYKILNTAVSYISIDVNPSVELMLNCFDNVVEVKAYNDEGNEVLNEIDLKGKRYTEAIDSLLSDNEFISYLKENDRLDFTVVSDKSNEIIEEIQYCKGYNQHNGNCQSADSELISQAHEHGLSVGKYKAYMDLARYDDTITIEDCKQMTMKQIHDMIEGHCKGEEGEHYRYGMNNKGKGHHRGRE